MLMGKKGVDKAWRLMNAAMTTEELTVMHRLVKAGADWAWGKEGDGIVDGRWDTGSARLMRAGTAYLVLDYDRGEVIRSEAFEKEMSR